MMSFFAIRKNASVGIPTNTLRTGGDEENRTPDPLLARQVLSQLSYTPVVNAECRMQNAECKVENGKLKMQNAKCRMQSAECRIFIVPFSLLPDG